jgi:hypothetical protein
VLLFARPIALAQTSHDNGTFSPEKRPPLLGLFEMGFRWVRKKPRQRNKALCGIISVTRRGINGSDRIGFKSDHYYFIIFFDPTPLHSSQKNLIHIRPDRLRIDPTRVK